MMHIIPVLSNKMFVRNYACIVLAYMTVIYNMAILPVLEASFRLRSSFDEPTLMILTREK